MNTYIKGSIKYWFNKRVSKFSFITDDSFISPKAAISRGCKVFRSSIDDYSYCAPNVELVCCHIGKFCSIGKSSVIGLASHTLSFISSSPVFTETKNRLNISFTEKNIIDSPYHEVIIGNDVWIGERVVIKGGIKIGNGAVIAAGAMVTKDVAPYSIVGGVPAKIIRKRFNDNTVSYIESLKWWDWNEKKIRMNIALFQQEVENVVDTIKSI